MADEGESLAESDLVDWIKIVTFAVRDSYFLSSYLSLSSLSQIYLALIEYETGEHIHGQPLLATIFQPCLEEFCVDIERAWSDRYTGKVMNETFCTWKAWAQ